MPQLSRLFVLLSVLTLFISDAAAGTITGAITNPEQCTGVQILRRGGKDPLRPEIISAEYDDETGVFRSPDLAAGMYDLRLLIEGGVLEGADLSVTPPDEGEPVSLTEADKKAIFAEVTKPVATYMDIHRPIMVDGHGLKARVLVEVIRHRRAHGRPRGEITWGIEIWTFENWTGAWVRPPASRGRRVTLRRLRIPSEMPADEFESMVCLFDPKLSGFEGGANGATNHLAITIPTPDVNQGKVAGSVAKLIEKDKQKNANRFE